MPADQAVLAEIARLDAEITRLRSELDALRRQVGAGPIRKHTKAFTSRPPAPDSGPVPTSAPPTTSPVPAPSVPASSQTVPTLAARLRDAGHVGLSDVPPPQTSPTPTGRRTALSDRDAGRYEFVGEGRSQKKSR